MRILPTLLLAGLLSGPAVGRAASPIKWMENDWGEAQRRAVKSKKLVAVDVWATWCHTCLSMKNFVLGEPGMTKLANKHVWLSLDYDLPKNAEFFKQFPINAFPTFLVIDPVSKKVVARWAGSGSADQMARFFGSANTDASDAETLGQRALADGDYRKAREIFEGALGSVASNPARTRLLAGYIEALWKIDQKTCAEVGSRYLEDTDGTSAGVDYASFVAMCAESLRNEETKKQILAKVRDRLAKLGKESTTELSVDDRSALLETLADALDKLGEKREARKVTLQRLELLEEAAKAARSPEERATFDAHRLACYIELRQYSKALEMLEASQRDMPDDFNHPWRLAILHHARGRTKEGLAAIDLALAKGYGPRRARLYSTKVDLLIQMKDYEGAAAAIRKAMEELSKMDSAIVRSSSTKQLESQKTLVQGLLKQTKS